jgi:hypothetical protein
MIPQPMQTFQYGAAIQLIVEFIDPIATAANGNVPVPLDISGATDLLVCLLYPDTVTSENFDAAFLTDGTDGKIAYTTTYNTDLIELGLFQIQGKATLGSVPILTNVGYFQVLPNTDNTD